MADPSTISRLPSFRDRALIATPTYSFARITVALKTEVEDLRQLRARLLRLPQREKVRSEEVHEHSELGREMPARRP